jgi:hypothetical protein
MRGIGLFVAFAGTLALALVALVLPAGAGQAPPQNPPTTLIIRKVVTGPATAGSTVQIHCGAGDTATLTFDKNGAPDTTSVGSFSKVDGAWKTFSNLPDVPTSCTFTETVNANATSTAWTCAYQSTEPNVAKGQGVEQAPGCAAASGAGGGPVTVLYGNVETNVQTQVSTVTFTNTYGAAQPVAAAPTFSG